MSFTVFCAFLEPQGVVGLMEMQIWALAPFTLKQFVINCYITFKYKNQQNPHIKWCLQARSISKGSLLDLQNGMNASFRQKPGERFIEPGLQSKSPICRTFVSITCPPSLYRLPVLLSATITGDK